ncbi:formin-like protein 11 [Typha angustifolia]|uniref:formin-like protein 11 n=1 Tax=Typha angustifolia TaxID=59011 RepID=UPI003C2D1996
MVMDGNRSGFVAIIFVLGILFLLLLVHTGSARRQVDFLDSSSKVGASAEIDEDLVNFPFHVPGEDDLAKEWPEYLEPILGLKRRLADQPSSAVPSLAPSPDFVSVPSPGPGAQHPNYGPAPSSLPAPASSPASSGISLAPSPSSYFPPKHVKPSQESVSPLPSKKRDGSKRSVVIAIVLTLTGTSFIVALLFVCWYRCCRNKRLTVNSQKDDSPLLSFNLSDFSGSSRKSYSQGSPIDINKLGALPLKTEANQNDHVPSLKMTSIGAPAIEIHPVTSNSSIELPTVESNSPAPNAPLPPPMIPPVPKAPAPPPPPLSQKPGPPPPPPPKSALPPRPPPAIPNSSKLRPPPGLNSVPGQGTDSNAQKTKLKPFFWDKVLANPDQSMVWDHVKSGSFQFSEEMIETLFGYNSNDKNKGNGKESAIKDPSPQLIKILDPKKSQNLAISLKALNVKVEDVCDAVMEGNELRPELLQILLKMAPTTDEELKLRLYSGDISQLGPAEQFLKVLIDIPYVYQRLDALLFMTLLPEEAASVKQSFSTLEMACKELRSSRLFLKLLEAVLKTGNRMNDGTFRGGAQAFKLDTLLKLADVKGTDGKTTLLHFVVQEIVRSEGVRAARNTKEQSGSISSMNSDDLTDDSAQETEDHYRKLGLRVVSSLGDELENVKKAAGLDADALASTVANLGHRIRKTKEFLNTSMKSMEEDSEFHHSLKGFVEQAEADVAYLIEEEKRVRSLVRSTVDYFHGTAGKDEGLRLFVIVRDFLAMLDKACREVRESPKTIVKKPRNRQTSASSPLSDHRQHLFPAIRDRRVDNSSSDDET